MEDRRRIKRRFLMYYSRVFDAGTEDLIGHLGDITPGGLMLITDQPLAVGWRYRLKLELSEEISPDPYLVLSGTSVWCQPDVSPYSHNTGFKLDPINEHEAEIIQRIVEKYSIRDA